MNTRAHACERKHIHTQQFRMFVRPFPHSFMHSCLAEVRGEASEADAEAKRLAGVGMANMRAAMAQGFQDSMKFMKVRC